MLKIDRICKLPSGQSFFLFGARGVGKTMLLKDWFPGKKGCLWIDLLSPSLELSLQNRPEKLMDLWKSDRSPWIVIDEVQKVPQLLNVVHQAIEEHHILFALTGSSARKLKRGGANLLAGRAIERKLAPLSVLELASHFDLQKALSVGLLPNLWAHGLNLQESTDFLYSYVANYLKEEVAAEQLVRNLDPFRRFLVAAAQCNGKIINHAAIERDAGVSAKQSARHFEILEDTLIGNFLVPFHTSIRKRQTQKAKFYFFDVGVTRALQNLAGEEVPASTSEYGQIFEALLINEFLKLNDAYQKRWKFSYFQTQHGREVDLIIERPRGKPLLIEIKSFRKVDSDKVSTLKNVMDSLDHEQAYLLSNDPQEITIGQIRCVHFIKGLEEIFTSY